jgi:hypothetical protein
VAISLHSPPALRAIFSAFNSLGHIFLTSKSRGTGTDAAVVCCYENMFGDGTLARPACSKVDGPRRRRTDI